MSAPTVQDASWLSYSFRTVTVRGGGGVVFNCGKAVSAPAVQDASLLLSLLFLFFSFF